MSADDLFFMIPETAPVFPLPNTVLFPRTVIPLHIFEERYRTMVADASASDGFIALSLLRPGWESEYAGSPPYHEIGCLGRIDDLVRMPDGRYYLNLVGLRKVFLGDLTGVSPYRTAKIRAVEESAPADGSEQSQKDLSKLLGVCTVLVHEMSEKSFPMVSVKEGLPYEAVVNSVCFFTGLSPIFKQALLEEDDLRGRCLKLTGLLEAHLQKLVLSRDPAAPSKGIETIN